MTRQDYFNTVLAAIRKQGRPAVEYLNGRRNCVYITENGDRCAIGWLVSEEEAKRLQDSWVSSVIFWSKTKPEVYPAFILEDFDFFVALQKVHDFSLRDSGHFLASFEKNAQEFAYEYDLEYTK